MLRHRRPPSIIPFKQLNEGCSHVTLWRDLFNKGRDACPQASEAEEKRTPRDRRPYQICSIITGCPKVAAVVPTAIPLPIHLPTLIPLTHEQTAAHFLK
ncbi:MAG: hypothetical protein NWR36_07965, partial [Opitutales bacterium]|nr:hypothetical protein [Opitutales bacterium]